MRRGSEWIRLLLNLYASFRTDDTVTHSILSNEQSALALDLVFRLGSKVKKLDSADTRLVTSNEASSTKVGILACARSTEHVVICVVVILILISVNNRDVSNVVRLEQLDTCYHRSNATSNRTFTTVVAVKSDASGWVPDQLVPAALW